MLEAGADLHAKRTTEVEATLGRAVAGGDRRTVALLIGAVAWFVGGLLLLNRIFFYPPVLFIVGLIAFIKGLVS